MKPVSAVEKLKFHTSWDWLMPVWLKICKMHSAEFGTLTSSCDITNIGISISAKASNSPKIGRLAVHGTFTIDDVYYACAEYIKWYNSQQK